ncbi:hypothetical protein LTR95_019187, partial [Oleoguttula sp. CCFEE 5521]
MKSFSLVGLLAATAAAQTYTDAKTGITFANFDESSEAGPNGFRFGIALSPATQTQYQNEYIGRISLGLSSGAGYGGISHGAGMTGNLLVVAWPNGNKITTSFRYATGY